MIIQEQHHCRSTARKYRKNFFTLRLKVTPEVGLELVKNCWKYKSLWSVVAKWLKVVKFIRRDEKVKKQNKYFSNFSSVLSSRVMWALLLMIHETREFAKKTSFHDCSRDEFPWNEFSCSVLETRSHETSFLYCSRTECSGTRFCVCFRNELWLALRTA